MQIISQEFCQCHSHKQEKNLSHQDDNTWKGIIFQTVEGFPKNCFSQFNLKVLFKVPKSNTFSPPFS